MRRLYLWPRFRVEVRQALAEGPQVQVIELHCNLTPTMRQIQEQVVALVDVCLRELRRSTHLDAGELTLENAMFKR